MKRHKHLHSKCCCKNPRHQIVYPYHRPNKAQYERKEMFWLVNSLTGVSISQSIWQLMCHGSGFVIKWSTNTSATAINAQMLTAAIPVELKCQPQHSQTGMTHSLTLPHMLTHTAMYTLQLQSPLPCTSPPVFEHECVPDSTVDLLSKSSLRVHDLSEKLEKDAAQQVEQRTRCRSPCCRQACHSA